MLPLRIGSFTPAAPVVLAPMAGVTNAAFRAMCRSFGPDLVYVNEMVMTNAVIHRNAKTMRMMSFGPDESPRSLQLYGSDPAMMGRAVHQICDEGLVDFGRGEIVPVKDLAEELMELVAEDMAYFDCADEVAHTRTIIANGTSAERQISRYKSLIDSGVEEKDALKAVVDSLIEETVQGT